ncbi:hypothetical protein [Trueperella pyogenes]|uniref:hypothetical protein n=2 Tax=Trueperella pyogenes TaxID=1661 RepID=UPI0013E9B019|nr:hypothetical protein [Trueperella pyogenes]
MFDHHATTDFASRITHPHIQTTSNQSFRHHTNEKYAQKQHKMANLKVESDRLKKHQTPPHQQKTRNQQHKMAYKPLLNIPATDSYTGLVKAIFMFYVGRPACRQRLAY